MTITSKYKLETLTFGVTGWDGILTSNFQKVEEHLHARRLVTLGEALASYIPVYMGNDGTVYAALADGIKQPALGILIEAGDLGDSVRLQRKGPVTNAAWNFSIGKLVYLGQFGEVTQERPVRNVQVLGIASAATTIFMEINGVITDLDPALMPTTTSSTTSSSSTTSTTTSSSSTTTTTSSSSSSTSTSSSSSSSSSSTSSSSSSSTSTTS